MYHIQSHTSEKDRVLYWMLTGSNVLTGSGLRRTTKRRKASSQGEVLLEPAKCTTNCQGDRASCKTQKDSSLLRGSTSRGTRHNRDTEERLSGENDPDYNSVCLSTRIEKSHMFHNTQDFILLSEYIITD